MRYTERYGYHANIRQRANRRVRFRVRRAYRSARDCEGAAEESIIYVGDSARCPYGPRSLSEVDGFVQQIGSWLVQRGVKLIVIACNTATAAGLAHAQRTFPVPVIGVVEPGARAAAHATRNKRVGVIATKATVESDAYTKAIRHLDAGITVFSTATHAVRRDSRAGHPHG